MVISSAETASAAAIQPNPVNPPVPITPPVAARRPTETDTVAFSRDATDRASATLADGALKPQVGPAPTETTPAADEPRHVNRRAVRRAERQSERLIRAADRRLDRLSRRFEGNDEAQKQIEVLRESFEESVRVATEEFVEGGARERRALRADLRDARKALRAGLRDLMHPRPAPTEPAPPTPTTPAAIERTQPEPVTEGGAQPAPEGECGNVPGRCGNEPAPSTPVTTRLVITYTSITLTMGGVMDQVG